MDSEQLLDVLDEKKTYQDVNKEIFVSKLTGVFDRYKNEGDTHLETLTGVCTAKDCSNKGCKGISFVGNKSGITLDLIIKNKNGEVQDIFYCRSLQTEFEKAEYGKQTFFHFGTDEYADFRPSIEYLLNVQKSDIALEEMNKVENLCFCKEEILFFVEKFKSLHEITFNPFNGYVRFNKFNDAFDSLQNIHKFIGKEDQIREALLKYEEKNMDTDSPLVNWLLKYEELGLFMHAIFMSIDLYNEIGQSKMHKIYLYPINTNYSILRAEFENEIRFSQLFSEKYWNLLERYQSRLTDSEMINRFNNGQEIRLKDHLDLSQFGINI